MTELEKKSDFNQKPLLIATALILVLAALGLRFGWFSDSGTKQVSANEIELIKGSANLDEQVKLYKQLINRVGAVNAQEELLRSGLPFTGQTHLLNHTVGEYLYNTEGPAGLVKCKDYFLSSCEHGFIILAIGDGGMDQLSKVFDVCRSNGIHVVGQCAHASGHGFLAWQGYRQLPEALKTCDAAAEEITDFPLFNCRDGVFMENIWGLHEGKPSPEQWISDNDPVYPCNDSRITYVYLSACWSNQPARMYQMFNRDIKKIGEECNKLEDEDLEEMCFNGLARQIHPIAAENVGKIFELCNLLPEERQNYCVQTIAVSSFSVGNRSVPFELCAKIAESSKQSCYESLFGIMRAYAADADEKSELCAKISEPQWYRQCN